MQKRGFGYSFNLKIHLLSQVTDLKYKMWYNDSALHSIPACINLINNILLKSEEAAAGITGNMLTDADDCIMSSFFTIKF